MRVEEMALRSEIRQMLNEAGFNRETLKQLVKESINDIIKSQVNQALMEREEHDLPTAVKKYMDTQMKQVIRSAARDAISDKVRWMNFKVNVEMTDSGDEDA